MQAPSYATGGQRFVCWKKYVYLHGCIIAADIQKAFSFSLKENLDNSKKQGNKRRRSSWLYFEHCSFYSKCEHPLILVSAVESPLSDKTRWLTLSFDKHPSAGAGRNQRPVGNRPMKPH